MQELIRNNLEVSRILLNVKIKQKLLLSRFVKIYLGQKLKNKQTVLNLPMTSPTLPAEIIISVAYSPGAVGPISWVIINDIKTHTITQHMNRFFFWIFPRITKHGLLVLHMPGLIPCTWLKIWAKLYSYNLAINKTFLKLHIHRKLEKY